MRRIWTTLLALPLVFASCSETPAADTKPAAGTIEVSIGSGPKIGIRTGAQTRTELDEDGKSVRWADNDRIVLWAVNSQAQTTIDRQVFKLWHYNAEYNTAKFTATVPEMPEDTYVYYAVSPEPVSAEGLKASYRIPAEQDGTFSGDCDIMVAAPVEGTALQQGDNSEMVNLEFDHKVHVLMIRIPSNDLGEEISKITLTFPEPVAGTLTVDAADPAAAPQLTDGSNILTLSFDTPKKPDDTVYAVIAPVELTSEQEVTITATGTTRESRPKTFPGKHFAEGHTTPISYSIPPVGPTTLRVSLPDTGKSTLGENITSFTLTAAEGIDLNGGGSNVLTFPVETAGNFDFVFDEFPEALAGQSVAVSYESENALLSGYIPVVSTVAQGTDADCAYNINADTAAAKLAVALKAEKLILLTDVRGLLRDPKDDSTDLFGLLDTTALDIRKAISAEIADFEDAVMIETAVRSGVDSAIILDGRVAHSILIELLSDAGIGTMLVH